MLPIRHPLHVGKAAASIDVLTKGRFVLGLASGDRPAEFPAFGVKHEERAERFRDNYSYLNSALHNTFPNIDAPAGHMESVDLVPKPFAKRLLMLIVGTARQSLDWIVDHADGWVTYPRDLETQRGRIGLWRGTVERKSPDQFKSLTQSLFIDLTDDPDSAATPIFLGYRIGRIRLIEMLDELKSMGVHHVIFNLRHSVRPAEEVMRELAVEVLQHFPSRPETGANANKNIEETS